MAQMSSPSEFRVANAENESDTNVDITVSHMTFVMAVEQNTNMDSYQNLEILKVISRQISQKALLRIQLVR